MDVADVRGNSAESAQALSATKWPVSGAPESKLYTANFLSLGALVLRRWRNFNLQIQLCPHQYFNTGRKLSSFQTKTKMQTPSHRLNPKANFSARKNVRWS